MAIPVGGQMTGQAKANIDALPTYSAPGSPGTQPVAATGAQGRAMNDSTGSGGTPPVSPAVSTPGTPATTTTPNPATTNGTAGLPGAPATIQLNAQQQATYDAGVAGLKKPSPAAQGLTVANNSKTPPPQDSSAGKAGATALTPNNTPPETPPAVSNFVDQNTNKSMAEQVQSLMDIVSPQTTRDNLASEMSKITDEKNTMAQEKMQLMNVKNVMAGSEQDIRDEITKANGFATNSQVLALTTARNATLLKDAQFLQDQLTAQQDLISNDTALLASDKADAASQLSTRMGLMQYIQTNQTNQLNAYKDSIKTIINTPGGLDAYANNPDKAAKDEATMGFAPGTLASMAKQAKTDQALKNNLTIAQTNSANRANSGTTPSTPSGGGTVNPILNPYLKTAYDGTQYVDLSSLTPSDKAKYAQISSASGLTPILDAGSAGKLSAISVSKENLTNIENSLGGILNDKEQPSSQGIGNALKGFFGNADIKSFKAWRTAIINNVQALAGGQGSGLRINKAEIDSAMENDLPVITGVNADNLATAQAKIAKLNSQLDTWNKQLLGGGNTAATHIPPVGTVIKSGDKSYHVIDDKGNLQPI